MEAVAMIDYRRYYQQCHGFTVPPDYDIHHIDGNRENNDIGNLTAIPRCLHVEYHRCLQALEQLDVLLEYTGLPFCVCRDIVAERVEWLEDEIQRTALENQDRAWRNTA